MINYVVDNAKLKLQTQIKILSYINHNIYIKIMFMMYIVQHLTHV